MAVPLHRKDPRKWLKKRLSEIALEVFEELDDQFAEEDILNLVRLSDKLEEEAKNALFMACWKLRAQDRESGW